MTESNWWNKVREFIDWLDSGKKYSLRIVPRDVEHAMLGLVVYEYCGELEELACHLCEGKYDACVRKDKVTVDTWLMQSRRISFTFFSLLLTATFLACSLKFYEFLDLDSVELQKRNEDGACKFVLGELEDLTDRKKDLSTTWRKL